MKRVRAKWLDGQGPRTVFDLVAQAGGEARIVGGAVRNYLLGEPVDDIDFATTLSPPKILKTFRDAGHSAHPTGIDHGTVTVSINHQPFEITTLRQDVETDGRRAQVRFTNDWQQDAARRDFTMNAIYCDASGKLYDFTTGFDDISKKKLVFVGVPEIRIKEDYLRILRYFRFLSTFDELKPDRTGLAGCVKLRKGLLKLSAERVSREMLKLLEGADAVSVLKLMAKHDILKYAIAHGTDFRTIGRLPRDGILRAFALARKPETLKESWRLSNEQAKRIEGLLDMRLPSPALRANEQRRMLYAMGEGAWMDGVRLGLARSKASLADRRWTEMLTLPKRWPAPRLPVSGSDLLALAGGPGPRIGSLLRATEEYWMASDFTCTREELLEWAKGEING